MEDIKPMTKAEEANIKLHICDTGIIQVAKDRRNHAGGYRWKYAND